MLALQARDDAPAQFVLDRGQLGGPRGLLAFVISGARPWVDAGREATLAATHSQARQDLGHLLRGMPMTCLLITEKRATFRCLPGLERPPMSIAPGLLAVGDHVDGPYPATSKAPSAAPSGRSKHWIDVAGFRMAQASFAI